MAKSQLFKRIARKHLPTNYQEYTRVTKRIWQFKMEKFLITTPSLITCWIPVRHNSRRKDMLQVRVCKSNSKSRDQTNPIHKPQL